MINGVSKRSVSAKRMRFSFRQTETTMWKRALIGISILALLAGCVTPQVPLTRDAGASLESAESVLVIPKGTLDVSVNQTYLGNGLIPALLAAYVDSKRQESVTVASNPTLQKLADYDFRAAVLQAWSTEAAKLSRFKIRAPIRLETYEPDSPAAQARKRADFEQSDAPAVMFADIDYTLRAGTLIVTAKVEIFPKASSLLKFRHSPNAADPLDEGNVIYRKTLTHEKEFVTPKNIRRSLDEGAIGIARKMAIDLEHTQP